MSTPHDQLPAKPRPEPASENQPYWAGLREHRLVVQRCRNCNKLRHYPRPMCDNCYSMDYDWFEVDGVGTVHTWSVSHHPFHPGFKQDLPYVTLTVDIAEGVRVQAPLRGASADSLKLGLAVKLGYDDIDSELTLPFFSLAT